uniref:Uncharacterized protein n=1 Tax=Rhizophora mucronata TaxID=61149 RepID=A0A2P2J9Z1_RHIMU
MLRILHRREPPSVNLGDRRPSLIALACARVRHNNDQQSLTIYNLPQPFFLSLELGMTASCAGYF